MRSYHKAYKKIGKIETSLADKLGVSCCGSVYVSPGVVKHIKKRHSKQLSRSVKENLIGVMQLILSEPEYVGIRKHRDDREALEFIKRIDSTLLLGIEIDEEEGYIYVSTLYPITKGKINNRLYSGRLLKCR